jgi:pimeloyl-ACP methyl ester carboxylesterase
MRTWLKVLLGIIVVLAVLLALNTIVTDHQTKGASVTVDGGEIVHLPGGDLQVKQSPATSAAPLPGVAGSRKGSRLGADPSPIVLLHCFTCAIDWWDKLTPLLTRSGHRVIATDLLGHGGSDKPRSGYSMQDQAQLVAGALAKLGVRDAIVVGHSLGGAVAIALAEQSAQLISGITIIDTEPDTSYGSLDLLARAALTPVIGEALWRTKVDASIRAGLGQAFAPGYDIPDEYVDDVKRMTYSSYEKSASGFDDYVDKTSLDRRAQKFRLPLLAIFGAEDQITDARPALSAYAGVPGAQTALIPGSGHSPNVEAPNETAHLILRFAGSAGAAPSAIPPPAAKSESAGPPITVGCDATIGAAGPPDWRKVAFAHVGRFGLGSKKAVPKGLAHYPRGKAGDLTSVQLQALVEGHGQVELEVPEAEQSRVGLVYGKANGAATLPEAARRVTFKPCPGKPRTVWPGGLALVDRRPITLDVLFGKTVRKLHLD